MSSIQEQLALDIALVQESVALTESDLRSARNAIAERADTQRRRHRNRAALAVAAAAAVAVVGVNLFQTVGADDLSTSPAGPNPTLTDSDAAILRGEPPSSETIGGLWMADNWHLMVLFRDDGTMQLDSYGRVFSEPGMTGGYAIDGSLVTISWDGTPCGETSLAMRVSILRPGAMRIAPTAPPGSKCAPFGSDQTDFRQVLPTSEELAGMTISPTDFRRPLSMWTALNGDWLAQGGGFVLEIDAHGNYLVMDSSAEPVDRGRVSQRRSILTLTSSAGSIQCEEGDVLTWSAMEKGEPGAIAIRTDVEQNTCGGTWTPKVWFVLPHVGP